MTPRSTLKVDFKEITAIEVRCKCGAVTSIPVPKESFNIEHFTCVGCNSMIWFAETPGSPYRKVKALIEAVSAWHHVEAAPFTLEFSLEAYDRASSAKD